MTNDSIGIKPGKILLVLLPFWTPQIPPMGISCIKSFLNRCGYSVKGVDANVELDIREGYDLYQQQLKEYIPEDKQGNFGSLINDVWQNHMMVHIHNDDENKAHYLEMVKELVYKVFFTPLTDHQVLELSRLLTITYTRLETWFLALLEKENPAVLGVSAFIGTLPASLFVCRLAKKHDPRIITVMGGGVFYDQLGIGTPNLEFFLEKTGDYLDKVIIGEGEILFLKFLQGKLPAHQRVYTLKDIGHEVVDLSRVEIPDISDFRLEYYPCVGAYASRSCPFQCNFCSDPVMWGTYRKKSPRQVAAEFTRLYETYRYQLFIMTDLLMNPLIEELAPELIKSGCSFYFDCPMRVWDKAGDIENTMLWRRAGYYRVEMGCESGSPRILQLMNKRITVEQTRAAISGLALAGIKTTTYWVIGYPGETEADFRMTLDLVEELKDDIYEAMNNAFWYYPGGQVHSSVWREKSFPLFSEKTRNMILLQQWLLDMEPGREERYRRVNRFVRHIKKLGIPDIITLQDLYQADERWKKLHKNAVPPLVEFKKEGIYIDENKYIDQIETVHTQLRHDDDWGF